MGFHCGNTASGKLAFCEMKYQMIMARALPIEVTQGTLEGDIKPGSITFYRLQSTSDNKLRAYIAQGEVLPVATRSFGSIGVFAIPEMGRFYAMCSSRRTIRTTGLLPSETTARHCLRYSSTLAWMWRKSATTSQRA